MDKHLRHDQWRLTKDLLVASIQHHMIIYEGNKSKGKHIGHGYKIIN